jgi:hypothetical protein
MRGAGLNGSGQGRHALGLATVEFVQPLELVVNSYKLIADVATVVDPFQRQEHCLDLRLAGDQHATFR